MRRDVRGLTVLAAVLALLGVVQQITIDAVRPSMTDMKVQLEAAANATPTGFVDQWTVFRISVVPVLPVMGIFSFLIAVIAAFCYGAAYHRALRRANGQPLSMSGALRAAAPRVPAMLGWGVLATFGTLIIFGLLLLPGAVTANPWLNIVGPLVGFLLVTLVITIALPTLIGVVFVEGAGFGRCLRLVTGRCRLALGRTLMICLGFAGYFLIVTLLAKLPSALFGGEEILGMLGRIITHIVRAALSLPLFGYLVATTLVSYAELRFREDATTTTRSLAGALR